MRSQRIAAEASKGKAYAFSTSYEKPPPQSSAVPQRDRAACTLRFQPNTTFRGPLSLLVKWDT